MLISVHQPLDELLTCPGCTAPSPLCSWDKLQHHCNPLKGKVVQKITSGEVTHSNQQHTPISFLHTLTSFRCPNYNTSQCLFYLVWAFQLEHNLIHVDWMTPNIKKSSGNATWWSLRIEPTPSVDVNNSF